MKSDSSDAHGQDFSVWQSDKDVSSSHGQPVIRKHFRRKYGRTWQIWETINWICMSTCSSWLIRPDKLVRTTAMRWAATITYEVVSLTTSPNSTASLSIAIVMAWSVTVINKHLTLQWATVWCKISFLNWFLEDLILTTSSIRLSNPKLLKLGRSGVCLCLC